MSRRAVGGLKFADLLPPDLAEATLAARIADHAAARHILDRGAVSRSVVVGLEIDPVPVAHAEGAGDP